MTGQCGTMIFRFLPLFQFQIVDFCDNNPLDRPNLHNREAPNKHNRLCGLSSSWEVMRQSTDFAGTSLCLSCCLYDVCMSVCLSVCLSFCLSVCRAVVLSCCLYVSLSVRGCVVLYVCLYFLVICISCSLAYKSLFANFTSQMRITRPVTLIRRT